ncbi:hypothetical protein K3495_g13224 [Podosphaera aphanis]|nr:hypothetical protein K3495_g13224 [Podosphaera aphanis]
MGYESRVSRVRQIAAQVEAMNNYRPNSSKLQTGTFFIPGRGTIIPHLSNTSAKQPLSDPDEDTIMGGVNALTAGNSKERNKGKKQLSKTPGPMEIARRISEVARQGVMHAVWKAGTQFF